MSQRHNIYDKCVLEFKDNSINQIVCNNAELKNDLFDLLTGVRLDRGVCVLGDINTDQHITEYKKKVDTIDLDRVDSTLNVKNYLVFYSMVTGIYHERTEEEIRDLFQRIHIEDLLHQPLNSLSKEDKIKIRCLGAYMKHVDCLIGKNLLDGLDTVQVELTIDFLKEHFCKNHCVCILFEGFGTCKENMDTVITI